MWGWLGILCLCDSLFERQPPRQSGPFRDVLCRPVHPPWAQEQCPMGGEGLPAEHPAEPQLLCCVMGLNRDNAYSRCSARYGRCVTRTLDRAMRSCWAPALGQACHSGSGTALLPSGQCRLTPVAQDKSHGEPLCLRAGSPELQHPSRWVMSWAPPGALTLSCPPPSPSKLVHLVITSSVPFRS